MSPTVPVKLPDFRKPPLVEVALSLQFEPLDRLTTAHIGLLWQRFRSTLPRVEEHPPLDPVLEVDGPPRPPRVEVSFGAPPMPRVWFANKARTTLIQVQRDRFIHNWRKATATSEYPRYKRLRSEFREELNVLAFFLRDEGLGELAIDQCEITYVNHVVVPPGIPSADERERFLTNWTSLPPSSFLPMPEDTVLQWRFRIPGDPAPRRLHVLAQQARRGDGQPFWVMNLMARGRPAKPGIDGSFEFFDLGHEWIVRGFADLTERHMHRHWRRIDAGTH